MTRIFTNCVEALEEAKRTLFEMGTKVHTETYQDKDISDDPLMESLELRGWNFIITDISTRKELIEAWKLDKDYLEEECRERRIGKNINPGSSYLNRSKTWSQFLEEDGRFSYTYAERMSISLERIIELLKENPKTRQAIIPIFWMKDIDRLGKRRIPCSMYYHLINRPDGLEMFYVMRSCDLMEHFPYDMYLAMDLQEYIANRVGVKKGKFHVFIDSLHAFRKDLPEEIF